MTDRLEYLKFVQYPPESITPSQFNKWKRDNVTLSLFKDLVTALFAELDNDLPPTFDQTIVIAHQREGAMQLMDQLLRWEPEEIKKARQKAYEQGKELEDADEN